MITGIYTKEEILTEDAYAKPHVEAGYKLHGGFDAEGNYMTPRMKVRAPAVAGWTERLLARGWDLVQADAELLQSGSYPSYEQNKLMIQNGLDQGLWNNLTITGVIEGRGGQLCLFTAPDFQEIIVEDISATAIGHLNKGLLHAHGADEGGAPGSDLGAHDAMWFAVRDQVFGKEAYPIPAIPESIARPDSERRALAQIPLAHEQIISLLTNVLMIEIRAENVFSTTRRILRDPDLFTDRRDDAVWAAEIVERIRQDEAIHVDYLRLVLSEMRSFTFKTVDGGTIAGSELIDPFWAEMVHWHGVENPRLQVEQTRKDVEKRVLAHPAGDELWKQMRALDA